MATLIQDFTCYNPDCKWVDTARPVTFMAYDAANGLFENPNPVCECHWGMGAVSAIYEPEAQPV